MQDISELKNNKTDYIAQAAKAAISLVPYAGSFLSEIVGTLIPNQRFDRICKYLETLQKRLEKLEDVTYEKEVLLKKENMFLIEASIRSAVETNSDKKYEYYAEFVINSIKNKDKDQIQKEKMLSLLSELNDIELILLIYYSLDLRMNEENQFYNDNEEIINPEPIPIGQAIEKYYPQEFNKLYIENLERLGLIHSEIEIDSRTKQPEYDSFTEKPKIRYRRATMIGIELARYIGAEKFGRLA